MSLSSLNVVGQHIINLPIENIRSQSDYEADFIIGNYVLLSLTVGAVMTVMANEANFQPVTGNGSPIPVGLAHVKLTSISGLSVDLLSTGNERQLTNLARQTLWSTALNLSLGTRPVTVTTRIVTANSTWEAGSYRAGTNFRISNILGLGNYLSTPNHTFEIRVPGIIAATSTSDITLLIKSFNTFRNGVSTTVPITVTTTVPYLPKISSSSNANLTFDPNGNTYNGSPPENSVELVDVQLLNNPAATNPVQLQSVDRSLTTASLQVPASNRETLNYQFSISAANLRSSFVQAGNYSTPLSYTYSPASTGTGASDVINPNSTLNIIVENMAEMTVNQKEVSLAFATAEHYQQGVSVQVPNHLTLSNTTPYNVFVRSEGSSLTADNGDEDIIPLDAIEIAPMSGQAGVNTVTLSNANQALINAADPVIDRNISLEYRVNASDTPKLLDIELGRYSTTVVFSFVEP